MNHKACGMPSKTYPKQIGKLQSSITNKWREPIHPSFLLGANNLIVPLYKEGKEKMDSMMCSLKVLILITPLLSNNETPQADNLYVTNFYNERGDSERNFDILNNDFNCNRLPFSYLNANMIYFFAAAISFTLFEWIKQIFFSKGVIENTVMRCKKFLFDFIILPAKWIKIGRQWVYKIFTTRTCYKPLFE